MTPDDDLVVTGASKRAPPIIDPSDELPFTEVHVSCTFTWQRWECESIAGAWQLHMPDHVPVKVGGPGLDDPGGPFWPGRYVKVGVSISSRGCPKRCPWCFVPKREGKLRLLPIAPGHIVQDNNVLAFPRWHFRTLIEMLRVMNRRAEFRGGLDVELLDDWHVEKLRSLMPFPKVWFSCDHDGALRPLEKALDKFGDLRWRRRQRVSRKLYCYVLIGHGDETVGQAEARLQAVWDLGLIPFSQPYRDDAGHTRYSEKCSAKEWKELNRKWSRPAAIFSSQAESTVT